MVHNQKTSLGHNLLDNADLRVQRPVPQPPGSHLPPAPQGVQPDPEPQAPGGEDSGRHPLPQRRAERSFTPESRHPLQPHSSSTSQGAEGGRAGGGQPRPAGAGVTPGPSLVQRGQPAAPGGEG